ncbi:MAG: hypothetical protein FWC56_05715 [Phycisphaerae bacterium]|nr:hypothetical protein [Phycisphaerae bacterium]
MSSIFEDRLPFAVGDHIRVTQQIVTREQPWIVPIEGEVTSIHTEPTGAWFAHGKDLHFWLRRIVLRHDDGEISSLIIDQNTQAEVISSNKRASK